MNRMEVQLAPISANPDVLKLYHKQKTEFHFQQKSDNEFLVFLLDVAVKVISFGKFSFWISYLHFSKRNSLIAKKSLLLNCP